MRSSPVHALAVFAVLAAVETSTSGCGSDGEDSPSADVAPALPPAGSGGLDAAPSSRAVAVARAAPRLSQRLLSATSRTAVPPDPSLPDPAPTPPAGGSTGLTGRAPGGTLVRFPLVHTRVFAGIVGNVARVEVTQYYRNPSSDRLETVYAFPLPANAAVTDMVFRVGRRVVASEVRPRDEAKRVYEHAKREGKTAALTEQERPNLFTQSLANVPPGETVAVVLRYVYEVPFDDGRYMFVFPTTIGPRYIPGEPRGAQGPGWSPDTDRVPDASCVTPPVLPPGFRPAADVDVLVRLAPGAAFRDVVSKNHRIVTGLDGNGGRLVGLDEADRVPDKDFVLSYRAAGTAPEAHALVQREKGHDYLMLLLQPPPEIEASFVRPKEVVFLVDKSGSMSGAPLETARRVVAEALRAMRPEDVFQLVAFDSAVEEMTAEPLAATPENVARAERWLAGLAGSGGTEMLNGIRAALRRPSHPGRLRIVVFCTDGFIGNEAEIIEEVEALRGETRVFGFGIGSSVNRFLIEGVARAGRGAAEVVGVDEPAAEVVARLARRLDRPILTDLRVELEGGIVRDLLPERLPDLFAGQPLVVAGRIQGAVPTRARLTGLLGNDRWSRTVAIEVSSPATVAGPQDEAPVLGTLWARRRIEDLETRRPSQPAASDIEEIVALALRFKLVTRYTSFVAVEHELLADPALPLARVIVPNELPDGVSYEGIFGAGAEVLPARVKPGDPEIRVQAVPGLAAVSVKLPFEPASRDAILDAAGGRFALRFLVPPAFPDGSYEAHLTLVYRDGRTEARTVPLRVDTSPPSLSVIAAPASVQPGAAFTIRLKPALPLSRLPSALGLAGGPAAGLRSQIEVKEILLRAPWGELASARMEGPLGTWAAELHVPRGAARGLAHLEVVAEDAAGNVSRRDVVVGIGIGRASWPAWALAVGLALGGFACASRRRPSPR